MYKIAMFFQGIFCDVYLISICYYRGLIITSIGVFLLVRLIVFRTASLIKISELGLRMFN